MDILNILTLLACLALSADIILQVRRIRRTKSSNDLSMAGMLIRYFAIVVILIKFISLGDIFLIIGQGVIVMTFTIYFILAALYFKGRKKA